MRIHHIVADIHRQDSGPSYSVVRLAEELRKLGHDVHLHTLDPRPERDPEVLAHFYARRPYLRSLGISPSMRRGLARAAEDADIMHFHGLWMMPNVYPAWAVRRTNCRLVMSPRGMLDPWALQWNRRRKWFFGHAAQYRALRAVHAFHATSEAEMKAIQSAGYHSPTSVIPIGIDMPVLMGDRPEAGGRRVLYLGRLHPKKNLEALIRAWTRVESQFPDWSLTIAGPGEASYAAHLRTLVASSARARLVPPAYGPAKAELLASADLFVLPTHSENFGIVVAEALSFGIPVIVSTGAPWAGIEDHECGWWVENGINSLAEALSSAMSQKPAELQKAGLRGRTWMQREFSWSSVALQTEHAYRSLLRSTDSHV